MSQSFMFELHTQGTLEHPQLTFLDTLLSKVQRSSTPHYYIPFCSILSEEDDDDERTTYFTP